MSACNRTQPTPAASPVVTLPVSVGPQQEVPSAKGIWLGTLNPGPRGLRLQVRLDPDGEHGCSIDSLDQASFGIECRSQAGPGDTLSLAAPSVNGIWSGSITTDGMTLTGTRGSITKTFTGLILAQMVAQKRARLDEPVRELLPQGTVAKPATGGEITLLDLSDQHSGLPRVPDNLKPAQPTNPYADYDSKALYAWVSAHGVALPSNTPFGYSNLGVGLLGQAPRQFRRPRREARGAAAGGSPGGLARANALRETRAPVSAR